MTHKELISKLIEHYQFGIDNLPEEEWDYFLEEHKLLCGICFCSCWIFDVDIYDGCNWIKNLLTKEVYICPNPFNQPRNKALEYLQIRLDALKSIDLDEIDY